MSTTFDTYKCVRKLKDSGFNDRQAEALTDAMREAILETELVTKRDLQIELAPIRTDLALLKWICGFLLAGVASLVLKTFF